MLRANRSSIDKPAWPTANAAYGAGNNEPVVIIADGDGQPAIVRHRIENGLAALSPEAADQTEILVFDLTFEEALGVPERFTMRQRVLERDRSLLRDRVRTVDVRQLAEGNPEIRRLLGALGLDR